MVLRGSDFFILAWLKCSALRELDLEGNESHISISRASRLPYVESITAFIEEHGQHLTSLRLANLSLLQELVFLLEITCNLVQFILPY